MMNTEHFSTHNVGELVPVEGTGAYRLNRFPRHLEPLYKLPMGKRVTRLSTGCEIRCVPENEVLFTVSSPGGTAHVHLFQGNFWRNVVELKPGCITEIPLQLLENLSKLPESAKAQQSFSPNVVRMLVQGGSVVLHNVDGYGAGLRPPTRGECPATRWLAWGSSITQADNKGYVHQAALDLGVDVENKGMSGSCGVEAETATWLCQACDWDFATLEWGVNLRGSLEPEIFEQRVEQSLEHFVATGKPVFLITPFLNDVHLGLGNPEASRRQNHYGEILRAAAAAAPEQVKLFEGEEILSDCTWLVGDLVHPSHEGHARMGAKLASLLRQQLPTLL